MTPGQVDFDILFDDCETEEEREFYEGLFYVMTSDGPGRRPPVEPEPDPPRLVRARFRRRWSDVRLQQFFDRFHALYWPGQFDGWRAEEGYIADVHHLIGFCDIEKRRVVIDLTRMGNSNRLVQGLLLHEMCHAAARVPGHGLEFFRQVERLLERGVRVRVVWSLYRDEPGIPEVLATLPHCAARFRRCIGRATS